VAELPGVCALGEVRHLWKRGVAGNELCSCGAPFHDCPFWSEVGSVAFGGWDKVDVDSVRALARRVDRMRCIPTDLASGTKSAHSALTRQYADYFARVYAAAGQVSGAGLVVDSSKNASTAYALRAHESINLRVVHVVRDSRGVSYSWMKRVPRPEAVATGDRPLMDQYPPWASALLWDAHNLALAVLGRCGVPVHRVLYEAFLADPVSTTSALAEFLGLIPAQSVGSFVTGNAVQLGPNHQVAGNPMRFRTGAVALRRDDEWRRRMSRSSRRLVGALTWPLLARYGYLSRSIPR
jgi:hypothetical protein